MQEITLDNGSGANKLALKTIDIFQNYFKNAATKDKKDFLRNLSKLARLIQEAQPSMTAIKNISQMILKKTGTELANLELQTHRDCMLDFLAYLKTELVTARNRIAKNALKVIPDNATIITLSDSSTVQEIAKQAHRRNRIAKVIIPESRPLSEGIRTAEELLKIGVPVMVIIDAAMGFFCREADLAIVGADTIQNDGSVVHKVGTYLLALACNEYQIPFYVAGDSLKISKTTDYDNPIRIEEKSSSEIIKETELLKAEVKNIYFDITPARLIRGIITEKGILSPSEISKISFL